jgi:hypothetical protein
MSEKECVFCSAPGMGLYSYSTLNGVRTVEEVLCSGCAEVVGDVGSVREFGIKEEF